MIVTVAILLAIVIIIGVLGVAASPFLNSKFLDYLVEVPELSGLTDQYYLGVAVAVVIIMFATIGRLLLNLYGDEEKTPSILEDTLFSFVLTVLSGTVLLMSIYGFAALSQGILGAGFDADVNSSAFESGSCQALNIEDGRITEEDKLKCDIRQEALFDGMSFLDDFDLLGLIFDFSTGSLNAEIGWNILLGFIYSFAMLYTMIAMAVVQIIVKASPLFFPPAIAGIIIFRDLQIARNLAYKAFAVIFAASFIPLVVSLILVAGSNFGQFLNIILIFAIGKVVFSILSSAWTAEIPSEVSNKVRKAGKSQKRGRRKATRKASKKFKDKYMSDDSEGFDPSKLNSDQKLAAMKEILGDGDDD